MGHLGCYNGSRNAVQEETAMRKVFGVKTPEASAVGGTERK